MSNKRVKIEQQNEEVEEPVTTEQPEATTVEPEVETPEIIKPARMEAGIIVGCARLRVRKEPNLKGTTLTELPVNTKVQINMSESTADWYKVRVKGVEGFCMKKYITLK